VTIAEEQLEYCPIVVAIVEDEAATGGKARVCRWTFSKEEREAIARGEDIYFFTPAAMPLIPHALEVGYRP
jgi:hypothetical protein